MYKLAFGPKAFVVVSDPIVARHILRENAFGYDKVISNNILLESSPPSPVFLKQDPGLLYFPLAFRVNQLSLVSILLSQFEVWENLYIWSLYSSATLSHAIYLSQRVI